MPKTQQTEQETANRLVPIPLDAITIGDQHLRIAPDQDDIIELAYDIQQRGLLQPIGVTELAPHRYQLLYGSRRLAAHHHLRRKHILARIHPATDSIRATALAENIHRAQLSLEEEVSAVTHLHTTELRSPDQIAALLSKSRSWVLRRLAIPELAPDLRTPLLSGKLSLGAVEEIAQITDEPTRAWCIDQASHGRLSIPELRATRQATETSQALGQTIQQAVDQALNQPPPPPIYFACAACGTKRLPEHLRVVRICADACPQPSPDTNT